MQIKIKGTVALLFLTISLFGQNNDPKQKTLGFNFAYSSNIYDFAPIHFGFVYQKNKNQIELDYISAINSRYKSYGFEFVYSFYPNSFKPCDWPRHFDLRIDNTLKYLNWSTHNKNAYIGIYSGIALRIRISKMIYFSTSIGFGIVNYIDNYHQTPQLDSNIKVSLMYNFKWRKWNDCIK